MSSPDLNKRFRTFGGSTLAGQAVLFTACACGATKWAKEERHRLRKQGWITQAIQTKSGPCFSDGISDNEAMKSDIQDTLSGCYDPTSTCMYLLDHADAIFQMLSSMCYLPEAQHYQNAIMKRQPLIGAARSIFMPKNWNWVVANEFCFQSFLRLATDAD